MNKNKKQKNKKIKLTYSKFSIDSKPAFFDAKYQRWSEYWTTNVTLVDIRNIIESGHIIRNAIYGKERFLKQNVVSAQIVALDFDDTYWNLNYIVEEAEKHTKFAPNISCFTLSHDETTLRYRLFWILDEPLIPAQWELIHNYFFSRLIKFKPDQQAKDISRLWFPGTGAEIYNYELVPVKQLIASNPELEFKTRPEVSLKASEASPLQPSLTLSPPLPPSSNQLRDLANYCALWRRYAVEGQYLNRSQRFVLFSGFKDTSVTAQQLLDYANSAAFQDSANFNLQEIERWLSDDLAAPQPIVNYNNIKLTISEYFEKYYTKKLF